MLRPFFGQTNQNWIIDYSTVKTVVCANRKVIIACSIWNVMHEYNIVLLALVNQCWLGFSSYLKVSKKPDHWWEFPVVWGHNEHWCDTLLVYGCVFIRCHTKLVDCGCPISTLMMVPINFWHNSDLLKKNIFLAQKLTKLEH